MMHILFLTDNFPPEVNAPATRTFEHTREWVRAGHQVTVITCAPNFPKGRIYKGYKNKLWQQEQVLGVRVIRVWTYMAANEGFLRRTLDYMSFMAASFFASLFVRNVDVVIGTSPQFFTVCAAYMVGVIKRVPWVFELRDIWPESIRAIGLMQSSRALDALEWLEIFLYHRASAIISVTNAFRASLIRRGVDEKKIHVVTNGVDISHFTPCEKDVELVMRYGLEGKFVAGYIGTHGLAHALDTVLDAAKKLKESVQNVNQNRFKFILLGDGANKADLLDRAKVDGLDNVVFIDSVTKAEVVKYLSILDVSIIHLKKVELFNTVIPSKIFESMGMGIPILHGIQGESAAIIEKEDVGLVFESENADALILGLLKLAEDQGLYRRIKANGPIAALNYDRTILANKMLRVLENFDVKSSCRLP